MVREYVLEKLNEFGSEGTHLLLKYFCEPMKFLLGKEVLFTMWGMVKVKILWEGWVSVYKITY